MPQGFKRAALSAALVLLAGCGGGGGRDQPATPPDVVPPPAPTPTPTPPPTEICNVGRTLCWPTAKPSDLGTAARRPRIILTTMLDDADYHDFGYYSTDAVTPNIDSIAEQGVRLSRYYSAAAICSPTRASILTGNSPDRYGLRYVWPNVVLNPEAGNYVGLRGLPDYDSTIAQSLSQEGYRTFHIGKWHVGTSREEYLPKAKGFDTYEITQGNPTGPRISVISQDGIAYPTVVWKPQYEADRIIEQIDAAIASGEDLYINWWVFEPHNYPDLGQYYVPPTLDRDAFLRDSGRMASSDGFRNKLITMMYAFDHEFGRVVDHLKSKNLYDDSLIVTTSDNGGNPKALSPTRAISGAKGGFGEGGIRVPFAASWPKRFASGTHSDLPFHASDLYPTIMGLVSNKSIPNITGRDLSSLLLRGEGGSGPMFFQLREDNYRIRQNERDADVYVLIKGCSKLKIAGGKAWLFNVCDDPAETVNLAANEPALLAALTDQLQARRLQGATYLSRDQITGVRTIENDARLDIHQDDLAFYATIDASQIAADGYYNLYTRGTGLNLFITNGNLVVRARGPIDTDRAPQFATVSTQASLPLDGMTHEVALVIRGYNSGGASIDLFIDGRRAARIVSPLDRRLVAQPSIFAIKAERARALIGDAALTLRDLRIFTSAIEPDEF